MWRRTSVRAFRPIALLTLLCAALILAGCGNDDAAADRLRVDAPLFTLDSEPADLADFVGTPLVVNFFAESCPPCVAEMPAFQSVSTEVAGEITFVGVSADATHAAARRIVEQTGITYPVVWDRDGTAVTNFQALGLPTTLLVDAEGFVVDIHTGELSADGLRALMAEHL